MNLKISLSVAAFVAGTSMSAVAHASIIVFSDRTSFTTATGATTVEDFGTVVVIPISSGILNSATDPTILPGVTYSTPVRTGLFFNIDAGGGYTGGLLD